MNRMTNLFAGFLLTVTPLAFGQEPQSAPQFPEDAMTTRQLIAWSRLQEPQPTPQPRPPRDNRLPQPGQQDQQGKRPADPTPQEQTPVTPITQAFSGKIIHDEKQYVLMAGNITYELRAEDNVIKYENQSVRVTGNLYENTNTIRVVKIELLF